MIKTRILSMFLVVIMLFLAGFLPYYNAYANAVAISWASSGVASSLGVSLPVLGAVAAIAIACGLVYTNRDRIVDVTAQIWENLSSSSKEILDDITFDSPKFSVDRDVYMEVGNYISQNDTFVTNVNLFEDVLLTPRGQEEKFLYNSPLKLENNIISFEPDTGSIYDDMDYRKWYLTYNSQRAAAYDFYDIFGNSVKYNSNYILVQKGGQMNYYFDLYTNGTVKLCVQYTGSSGTIQNLSIGTISSHSYDDSICADLDIPNNWEEDIPDTLVIPGAVEDVLDGNVYPDTGDDTGSIPDTGGETGDDTIPDTGTVNVDLSETNSKIDEIIDNINNNNNIDPNFDSNMIRDKFEEKLNINVLKNALERLQNINTEKGKPPVITINLHSLFDAGLKHINPNIRNPFKDEETKFIDFGLLENFNFGGYTLVDYFRTIVGAGFIYTTLLYVWRKIVPDKVVSR